MKGLLFAIKIAPPTIPIMSNMDRMVVIGSKSEFEMAISCSTQSRVDMG